MSCQVECPKCKSEEWSPSGYRELKHGKMKRVKCECGYLYSFPIENHMPKILFLDIETAPMKADVWGLWKQNVGINQLNQNGYVLCVCGNMNGKKLEVSLPEFKLYHREPENDVEVICEVWEWLDEAAIIIGQNIWVFDLKTLNGRFLFHELLPPSPYKFFDTLKTARSKFKLPSNKLDYIAQFLGVGKKMKTGGHELWTGCTEGDKKSWKKMIKYCHHDVDILIDVYNKLLPWATNHPNMALFGGTCKNCGSDNLEPLEKTVKTNVNEFKAYRCEDCGHIMRDRKAVKGNDALTSVI